MSENIVFNPLEQHLTCTCHWRYGFGNKRASGLHGNVPKGPLTLHMTVFSASGGSHLNKNWNVRHLSMTVPLNLRGTIQSRVNNLPTVVMSALWADSNLQPCINRTVANSLTIVRHATVAACGTKPNHRPLTDKQLSLTVFSSHRTSRRRKKCWIRSRHRHLSFPPHPRRLGSPTVDDSRSSSLLPSRQADQQQQRNQCSCHNNAMTHCILWSSIPAWRIHLVSK